MSWDDYSDSEAFYQKVSFPLSETWRATVRWGYNLRSEDLEEMYYRLGYSNNCCYRFSVEYRDDLTNENDDWAGFVFVLDAFPSNPFFFNTRSIQEFDK
jgi:lipopolysaccharide assembly outer membrane protein LptD (OstA)